MISMMALPESSIRTASSSPQVRSVGSEGLEPEVVLRAFLAGIDPFAGRMLDRSSPLAHPAAQRALKAAIAAIAGQEEKRNGRRQGMSGQRWSDDDHQALIAGFEDGVPLAELAARFDRTELAIASRLVKYGRLEAEAVQGRIPNAAPRPIA